MKQFGVRPYPEQHESLNGYLLRIGAKNGLFKLSSIFAAISAQQIKSLNMGRWTDREFGALIKGIAPLLDRELHICSAPFQKQLSTGWLYSEHRMIQDIRLDFPRVCPHCITESGILDWHWGLAIYSSCPKHDCLLLDTCPDCCKPLEWESRLLKGCTHCDFNWDSVQQINKSPHTLLEARLWQSVRENRGIDLHAIADVCAAIAVIARPFDSLYRHTHAVPNISNYSALVQRAYLVLESKIERSEWVRQSIEKRKCIDVLGSDALRAPLNNLNKLLERPLSLDFSAYDIQRPLTQPASASLSEYPEFTKLARQVLANTTGSDSDLMRYHVDASRFADYAQIAVNDLQQLVDANCLTSLNTTNVLRDQLFDLRDLVLLLDKVSTVEFPESSTVELSADSQELKSHFARYGALIGAVLNKEVRGWIQPDLQFGHINVHSEDLKQWLRVQLQKECTGPISMNKAMSALQCGETTLRNLVREGCFSWARWRTGKEWVDGPSLFTYLTR